MRFVKHSKPRHLAEKIEIDKEIYIWFHVDVNKDTITNDTLFLFNVTEQKTEEVTFTYKRKELVVFPVSPLQANAHYKLTLVGGSSGIQDIVSRKMSESYQLEFYTASSLSLQTPAITFPVNKSVVQSEELIVKLNQDPEADFTKVQISDTNRFHQILMESNVFENEWVSTFDKEESNYFIRAISYKEEELSNISDVVQFYYKKPDEDHTITPRIQIHSSASGEKETIDSINEQLEQKKSLEIKKSMPPDGSAHLSNEQLKKIKIKLNDNLDSFSVNQFTCYVIKEKN